MEKPDIYALLLIMLRIIEWFHRGLLCSLLQQSNIAVPFSTFAQRVFPSFAWAYFTADRGFLAQNGFSCVIV